MSIPVLVIPVLNRFDLLEESLQSIDYPIDNILIIDNSNSYTWKNDIKINDALNGTTLQILNMPANMGVAGSWNLGIKCFPHAPYWLIGSNDTKWLPGGLQMMEELAHPDKLVMSNVAWNSFALGSGIVKKIGLFDENYYPAYSEDSDYMERLRIFNMLDQIVWSTAPTYHPHPSQTAHSNEKFWERNIYTNEQNWRYRERKIRDDNPHLNCIQYDLQRRIDHEWLER